MGEWFIVTERCATIRMLARESLEGKWKIGFVGVMICNLIVSVPSLVLLRAFGEDGVFPVLAYYILVSGPVQLGLSIFVLTILRNREPRTTQVFYGFENFGRALGLSLMVSLMVAAWSLISFPALMASAFFVYADMWIASMFLLPLVFVSLIPAITALIRYSQAFFVLADNHGAGIFECINRSKQLMSGNKGKYFLLSLSFIGWALLAGLPAGIAEVAFPAAGADSIFGMIMLSIIPMLGVYVFWLYVYSSLAVFYDMASGNLRPGFVQATVEIVSENRIYPQEEGRVSLHKDEASNRRE